MAPYLVVMVVAGIVSYAVTPAITAFSRRIGAVDIPDDRKVHAAPTPTLGGASIFLGVLAAMAAAISLEPFAASFRPLVSWPPSEPVGIIIATAFVFGLGALDDLRGLPPPVRLSGQVLAAGFAFISGVRLQYLRVPLGTDAISLSADFSAIVTIVWIVAIVNAVNLIDGLDGLAAGIASIAAGAFFIYSYQLSQGLAGTELLEQNAPLISIALLGSALGFLRYNFNPAKIFMGDSGSYTLGFLLAVATVVGVGRATQNPIPESLLFYLPLAIPLVVLAIPILDVVMAVVRRARKGRHIFHADKEHLHHRLLEIGHGHRQAVLIMYAWAGVVAGLILTVSFVPSPIVGILFGIAAVVVFVFTMLPRIAR